MQFPLDWIAERIAFEHDGLVTEAMEFAAWDRMVSAHGGQASIPFRRGQG